MEKREKWRRKKKDEVEMEDVVGKGVVESMETAKLEGYELEAEGMVRDEGKQGGGVERVREREIGGFVMDSMKREGKRTEKKAKRKLEVSPTTEEESESSDVGKPAITTNSPETSENTEGLKVERVASKDTEEAKAKLDGQDTKPLDIADSDSPNLAPQLATLSPTPQLRLNTDLHRQLSSSTWRSSPASTSQPPSTRHSTAPDLPPPPSLPTSAYGTEKGCLQPHPQNHNSHPVTISIDATKPNRPRHYHRNQALEHARAAPKFVREFFTRTDENAPSSLRVFSSNNPNPRLTSSRNRFRLLKEQHKARKQQKQQDVERKHPWYSEIMLTPHRFNSCSQASAQWSLPGSSTGTGPMSWQIGSEGTLRTYGSVSGFSGFSGAYREDTDYSWTELMGTGAGRRLGSSSAASGITSPADLSRFSISLAASSEVSLVSPPQPRRMPAIAPLHLYPQRCVWEANEMSWMVAPIPTVEERNLVAREIWRRKQVAGCWIGGEDWGSWRAENFVDASQGVTTGKDAAGHQDDTAQPTMELNGEQGHEVETENGKMSVPSVAEGSGPQLSNFAASPVSTSKAPAAQDNKSSSRPSTAAICRPPNHRHSSSVTMKTSKLTLELPDMEPSPVPITSQSCIAISALTTPSNSDDGEDDSWYDGSTEQRASLDPITEVVRKTVPGDGEKNDPWHGYDDGMVDAEVDDDPIDEWVEWIQKIEEMVWNGGDGKMIRREVKKRMGGRARRRGRSDEAELV